MKPSIEEQNIAHIAKLFEDLLKSAEAQTADNIMSDGILCLEQYNEANTRILWVLKQNIHDGWDAYADQVKNSIHKIGSSPTWRRLAYVSHAIISGERNFEKVRGFAAEKCGSSLLATAIIQANKEQGDSRSADIDILSGYERYKDLIREQVVAYKPDVVIVAMSGGDEQLRPIVVDIYKHFTNEREYATGGPNIRPTTADVAWSRVGNKVFLWAFHPAYPRVSEEEYFKGLVEAFDAAEKVV